MYSLFISVPFQRLSPTVCQVAIDWGKSLLLLRDALGGRFGPIVVAAPQIPEPQERIGQQVPVTLNAERDDIRFVALGSTSWRARHYWLQHRRVRAICDELAHQSQVVHAGINDIWQPFALAGFYAAVRAGTTAVLVLDGDAVQRVNDMRTGAALPRQAYLALYAAAYYRIACRAVARADLALLKGASLHQRYGGYTAHARDFFDTSYSSADIIPPADLARKRQDVARAQPIRCLSLGRLVDFKGVDQTIHAVTQAKSRGANVLLDIVGEGPDEQRLRRLVKQLNAEPFVRFLGSRPYGAALLREIATYHLMLFTPTAEETPRALFDGLAGGCALLAYQTPFTREVVGQFHHGFAGPANNPAALADHLASLDRDRTMLAALMQAAADAAKDHSVEVWYRRRAEWTIEAYERKMAQRHGTKRP